MGRLRSRACERGVKGEVTRVAVAHEPVALVDEFWLIAAEPLASVAADELRAIDVSDPRHCVLVGALGTTNDGPDIQEIAVAWPCVYALTLQLGEGSGGILVFDVAQPQGPELIAVWQSADLTSPEALAVAGRPAGVGVGSW